MTGRRVYLVRHGETEGQSSIRFHGRSDVPLNDEGRAQLRGLTPWLPQEPVAVVHSPLQRAREAAEIFAELRGWGPELMVEEPDFVEISFGHCEGMTAEEIADRMPEFYAAWQAGRTEGFPGGETRAAFGARITRAFRRVVQSYPQGDLLVVAHRGVVRWGMRLLLGIPDEQEDDYAVDLGSLTILHGGDRYEVEQFNLVAEKNP